MKTQEQVNSKPVPPVQSIPQVTDDAATGAVRVILADSQAIYRVGMRKVFALEDDIRVVAQAETLANLYTALQRYPTDVVVLEGQLIAGTTDAIPELVRRAPWGARCNSSAQLPQLVYNGRLL